MPTYGYRCTECGHDFDLWQSMRDDARADCPTCGAAARRLFFPAGIVFKGSGFYKTDSRGSSSATSAVPDKATKPDARPAESGSPESGASGGSSRDGGAKDTGSKEAGPSSSTPSSGSTAPAGSTGGTSRTAAPSTGGD